jgi:hypothetical protein
MRLADSATFANRAYLGGEFAFKSARHFTLVLDSSAIFVNNEAWLLDDKNRIAFDSTTISFQDVNFNKGNEHVTLSGALSKSESDQSPSV